MLNISEQWRKYDVERTRRKGKGMHEIVADPSILLKCFSGLNTEWASTHF